MNQKGQPNSNNHNSSSLKLQSMEGGVLDGSTVT